MKYLVLLYAFALSFNLYGQDKTLGENNIAHQWGNIALDATAFDTERFSPRPTITSRYLGLTFIAIFDAWSRFDEKAIPVYIENVARAPKNQQTLKNKEIAISYAAYNALKEYYYSDSLYFKNFMLKLGLNPENKSTNPNTPEGIGNLAAMAVIKARKHDGANQYGEEKNSGGQPYYNYINYKPVNSADTNEDINRWQPKYFADGKGGKFAPECLTPFWYLVKPITLKKSSQFRPIPPPVVGSPQLNNEIEEVVELQANLTDEQKALVEFMRDGPKSVQQAGHWLIFALKVSKRDNHSLDEDVKMLFYNQITAMDAFIASWESKMYYDYARPYALVHDYYKNDTISGWAGEGKPFKKILGTQWRPYSPETFLCPPFPSYVSGHSCVSGACAQALKLFKNDDYFGEKITLVAGALTEPDNVGDTVTLYFPTFTETANMAGISRVLGGYHIQADNVAGLQLGRDVANEAWKFYLFHIGEKTTKH